MSRICWIDASAGVAGDMLLGALVDAGAALPEVQLAVDAVIPASVRLAATEVTRAGLRGTKLTVDVLADDPPHRSWRTIAGLLRDAVLPERVREDALAVFGRLAGAEGRVHGVPADDIHFHEVGALDSIADVVGVCAALHGLGVDRIAAGELAVGSGTVRSAHGEIPVPVPAVTELALGWHIRAGGAGELTTPTGMALLATLAENAELPPMTVAAVGTGAGTRDTPGRPNVTRVLIGDADRVSTKTGEPAIVLEANVDDLDPRVWPGVLTRLLDEGAADAWLTPILMKKGRPAHTLSVLCRPHRTAELRAVMLAETTTLGVREQRISRYALPRAWVTVQVDGAAVRVKLGLQDGVIVQATPEFEDVAAMAAVSGIPLRQLLDRVGVAAAGAGIVEGASWAAQPTEPDPAVVDSTTTRPAERPALWSSTTRHRVPPGGTPWPS